MAVLEGKTFMNVPGVVIICTEIELCFVCPIKCIDTISDAVVLCAPPRSLALWLQKRAGRRQIFRCANSLAAERRLMLELRDAFAVQLFTWTGKCHISVCNHHLHTLVTHTAAYIAVFGHAWRTDNVRSGRSGNDLFGQSQTLRGQAVVMEKKRAAPPKMSTSVYGFLF
jgi:hypothetical protein